MVLKLKLDCTLAGNRFRRGSNPTNLEDSSNRFFPSNWLHDEGSRKRESVKVIHYDHRVNSGRPMGLRRWLDVVIFMLVENLLMGNTELFTFVLTSILPRFFTGYENQHASCSSFAALLKRCVYEE